MANEIRPLDTDRQIGGVTIGKIIGGIHNSIIAGRDVMVQIFAGETTQQRAQRNRQAMLKLVNDSWVSGVLENSLHGAAMIELGLEECQDAVERPWEMVLQTLDQPDRTLPPGTRIVDVFAEMGQALLILGAPGSGKTTMLLELTRDTIARAEQDPTHPIPVVFNLSSWAERRQSLADWLVDELNTKYHIPKKITHPWVKNNELVLLLDGLDEVRPAQREACVKAINDFRQEHLVPLVVCSRTEDYENLTTRLKLRGAVLIQPLTRSQIDDYLNGAGVELLAVRRTLEHDHPIQELAQSPLMLSIMTLAYRGKSVEELHRFDSVAQRRAHLFEHYIDRMFERVARTKQELYPKEQTINWLTWLAQKMTRYHRTIFLIEQLQPSWLSTRAQRWFYMLGSRLIGGLIVGWAFVLLFYNLASAGIWYFEVVLYSLLSSFGAGVGVGLVDGLRFVWRGGDTPASTSDQLSFWRSASNVLITGLSAALGSLLVLVLVVLVLIVTILSGDQIILPDDWNWIEVMTSIINLVVVLIIIPVGLPVGLILGLKWRWQNIEKDIQTVEELTWSWKGFLMPVLVIGMIFGALTFIVTSFISSNPMDKGWGGEYRFLSPKLNEGFLLTSKFGDETPIAAYFGPDGTGFVTKAVDDDSIVTQWNGQDGTWIKRTNEGLDTKYDCHSLTGFSDGTRIVTVDGDTVRLWDEQDCRLIAELKGHTGRVIPAFSPDGARMVTVDDDTVRLWDGRDGRLIAELEGHVGKIQVAISPKWARMVTVDDDTARLWDGQEGTLIAELEGHMGKAQATFSPNGTRMVTVDDDTARLWDGQEGALIAEIEGHTGPTRWMDFSPDGTRIATDGDGGIRLWDGQVGRPIAKLKGHPADYGWWSGCFSPDGTRMVTVDNDTVWLWDGRDGTPIAELKGHVGKIHAAFSSNGTRIVTVDDDTVRRWDTRDGRLITKFRVDYRPISALWLLLGLAFGLIGGARSNISETTTSPNQGIKLSARNAVVIGLIGGLIATLTIALTIIPAKDILLGAAPWDIPYVPLRFVLHLSSWLPLLLACGILVALWYGGLAVFQHFILRLILSLNHYSPWRYARFLDYATERIFLRKVGGGYIFIHRLLLEYFASLEPKQAE